MKMSQVIMFVLMPVYLKFMLTGSKCCQFYAVYKKNTPTTNKQTKNLSTVLIQGINGSLKMM